MPVVANQVCSHTQSPMCVYFCCEGIGGWLRSLVPICPCLRPALVLPMATSAAGSRFRSSAHNVYFVHLGAFILNGTPGMPWLIRDGYTGDSWCTFGRPAGRFLYSPL